MKNIGHIKIEADANLFPDEEGKILLSQNVYFGEDLPYIHQTKMTFQELVEDFIENETNANGITPIQRTELLKHLEGMISTIESQIKNVQTLPEWKAK